MDPWQVVGGNWAVNEGVLVCTGGREPYAISAKVEQREAVTAQVEIDFEGRGRFDFSLVLCAESYNVRRGRLQNGLLFNILPYEIVAYMIGKEDVYEITEVDWPDAMRRAGKGTLRVCYNPKARKVTMWAGMRHLGEFEAPKGPQKGKYVLITCEDARQAPIRRITVYSGVVPPGQESDVTANMDTDVLALANGDRFSATSVSVADGLVTATSATGQLQFPLKHLAQIVLRRQGRQLPRRNSGDVTTRLSRGRLTLQLERLSDEYLIGTSDYLGALSVRRAAVRQIDLNIYRRTESMTEPIGETATPERLREIRPVGDPWWE
jgi:hypothetical protein